MPDIELESEPVWGLPQVPIDPVMRAEFWREWPRLAASWGMNEIVAAKVYELCELNRA